MKRDDVAKRVAEGVVLVAKDEGAGVGALAVLYREELGGRGRAIVVDRHDR